MPSVSEHSNISHVNNNNTPIFIHKYLTKVNDPQGSELVNARFLYCESVEWFNPFRAMVEINRSL